MAAAPGRQGLRPADGDARALGARRAAVRHRHRRVLAAAAGWCRRCSRCTPLERRRSTSAMPDAYATVVAAAFSQRRKTLRNSLRRWSTPSRSRRPGSTPAARPETLAPAQFAALAAPARADAGRDWSARSRAYNQADLGPPSAPAGDRHARLPEDPGLPGPDRGQRKIAERAKALAAPFGAELTLLHVVEYVPVEPMGEALLPAVQIEGELVERARLRLAELAAKLGLAAASGSCRPATSRPRSCASRSARRRPDRDRQPRAPRPSILLNFTEDTVLHAAPCDVLAVRLHSE